MRTLATLVVALLVPLAVIADADPDDVVNNPPFASWSSFPLGTTVEQKETVMLADGRRVDQTFAFKLLEKTTDRVVVEMTRTDVSPGSGGEEKVVTTYPAKVKRGQVDTPRATLVSLKEGEAKIEVQGKKIDTEWVEVVTMDGGDEVTETIWTARQVPGGLVKQSIVRKSGGKKVSESYREVADVKSAG